MTAEARLLQILKRIWELPVDIRVSGQATELKLAPNAYSYLGDLPQLFNVLNGQLSLVGPRPHATQAKAAGGLYEEVVEGYFARHKEKPGITGWAQINGWRGETDTVEKIAQRVNHDLEYINRWSLGFDFYILMKTPFALLKSENAY